MCCVAAEAAQGRQVEVFASTGVIKPGGDEGPEGTSPSFGGALTVPLTRAFAAHVDVQVAPRIPGSARTRTLFSPGIQWRRHAGRMYAFVAAGVGTQIDHGKSSVIVYAPDRRVLTYSFTDTGLTLHGQTGFVAVLTRRVLLRLNIYSVFRYVQPNVGVTIGVGWRL